VDIYKIDLTQFKAGVSGKPGSGASYSIYN